MVGFKFMKQHVGPQKQNAVALEERIVDLASEYRVGWATIHEIQDKRDRFEYFFKKTSKIWRTIERCWTQQNFPKLRIVSTSGSSKRVVTRQSQMKSFGKKPTFLNKEIWRKKILWPIKDSWRNSRNGLGFGCWGSLVWCRTSKGLLYVFENKLSLLFGEKTAIVLGKQTSSWWERLQHSFQKAE